MKKLVLTSLLILCVLALGQARELGLIPMPNSIRENAGKFNVGQELSLWISSDVSDFNTQLLDSLLREDLKAGVDRVA